MDSVRHPRRGAARVALFFACCGLAVAAGGQGALAEAGQARDMTAGGAPPSHPAGVADAIAATAGSRSRGLSRATGALRQASTLDYRPPAAATLEKCVTSANPLERYATFAGRMNAVAGSTGMAMRIGIEVRSTGEAFHLLESASAPGLGAWRSSEPGVKIFKDLKQVTNLSVPVDYRGVMHFRWTNAKGIVIKREMLRTPVCRQIAPEGEVGGEAPTARMLSR